MTRVINFTSFDIPDKVIQNIIKDHTMTEAIYTSGCVPGCVKRIEPKEINFCYRFDYVNEMKYSQLSSEYDNYNRYVHLNDGMKSGWRYMVIVTVWYNDTAFRKFILEDTSFRELILDE